MSQNTLKDEDLEKMAIADIKVGKPLADVSTRDSKAFNYNHILSPEHKKAGYSVVVVHRPKEAIRPHFKANLLHNNNIVGHASGYVKKDGSLEPHSEIKFPEHRGKGLGTALYEALYTHARSKGVNKISGWQHSEDAARVHRKLAQKHGLKYQSEHIPASSDDEYPYSSYNYMIKSDLSEDDEITRLLKNPNQNEASLALKLDSVTPQHLYTAIDSNAGDIIKQALNHSKMSEGVATYLMGKPNSSHYSHKKQLLDSNSSFLNGEGVNALYNASKSANNKFDLDMLNYTVKHPELDKDTIKDLWNRREYFHQLLENPSIPGELLNNIETGDLPGLPFALILKHPNFSNFDKVMFSDSCNHIKRALLDNPNLPEEHRSRIKTDSLRKNDENPMINVLGLGENKLKVFEAARFLASGPELHIEEIDRFIALSDGKIKEASLRAYHLPVNEKNLKALEAIIGISEYKKAEAEHIHFDSILAARDSGKDFADLVNRTNKNHLLYPIVLGGKHTAGSYIANDLNSDKTLLLKPGSGKKSPAKGVNEESATQSEREAAFYHVAKEIGLEQFVPETQMLLVNGKQFAAIELLPNDYKNIGAIGDRGDGFVLDSLRKYLKDGTLHKWAVLDFILGNVDRHSNNVLINEKGEIRLIDHGSSMAGKSFNPGSDKNTFVPYYLRAWALDFGTLSPQDKLKKLPVVNYVNCFELEAWINNLDKEKISYILNEYHIDPKPFQERLAKLKMAIVQDSPTLAINKLWVL